MMEDSFIDDAYRESTVIYRRLSLLENKKYCLLIGVHTAAERHQMLIFEKSDSEPCVVSSPAGLRLSQVHDYITDLSQQTAGDPLTIKCTAEALLGLVYLLGSPYLLLATKATEVGKIAGHAIYSVSDTYLHSVASETAQAQNSTNKDHQRLKQLFKSVDISAGDFFFSYSYDLTRSLQFNSERARNVIDTHHYDDIFAWNYYLAQALLDVVPAASNWTPALIHGFFSQIANIDVAGMAVNLTLIARRSRKFAGTRYNRRGTSKDGYVANHVESELIVSHANRQRLYDQRKCTPHCSLVFMRGSIPLFWAQEDPFSPRPEIKVTKVDVGFETTEKHFRRLLETYGAPIICLSLVKKKESVPQETIVGNLFEESIAALSSKEPYANECLLFESFDLLQAKDRQAHVVSEISELITKLGKKISFFSIADIPHLYTTTNNEFCPDSKQVGVVRVNCIDCLDRTNIAQFCLAKVIIMQQLVQIGVIFDSKTSLSEYPDLDQALRELFVNQGDQIALQYAGSAAMHKDALKSSAAQESSAFDIVGNALTAVKRYYSNAITDFDKQYGIAIFLGDIIPDSEKPFPWTIQAIPASSNCDEKYGAVNYRWRTAFSTQRDVKIARRLLFDDNYNPTQITSFWMLQNPQPDSLLPTPKHRRDSLSDLGGKEFFEETIKLESNIPVNKDEPVPAPADEKQWPRKSQVSQRSPKYNVKPRPAHFDHFQLVTPRAMKVNDEQIRFYERYLNCDWIETDDDLGPHSEWRKDIEKRLRLLESHN